MTVSTFGSDPSFEGMEGLGPTHDRFGRQVIQVDDMLFHYKGNKMSASGGRQWPRGRIPMHFDNLSDDQQQKVRRAANLWLPAGIQFVDKGEQDAAYLHIMASRRNLTTVGFGIVGAHSCELASWDDIGTLTHELGHAIGLEHEQSRTDRNGYIQVNDANLTKAGKEQFAISSRSHSYTNYDLYSIMHYTQFINSTEFVIDVSEPAFYLRDGVEASGKIGMGSRPTDKDIQGVLKFYRFR